MNTNIDIKPNALFDQNQDDPARVWNLNIVRKAYLFGLVQTKAVLELVRNLYYLFRNGSELTFGQKAWFGTPFYSVYDEIFAALTTRRAHQHHYSLPDLGLKNVHLP